MQTSPAGTRCRRGAPGSGGTPGAASFFGRMSTSKMESGSASVATALGMSTMPEMRPSQGQHDSSRYACSRVKPNFAR